MTRLDPATLRSVAKELRKSARTKRAMAKADAKAACYAGAADWQLLARHLDVWAGHFYGQATSAEKAAGRP